MPLTHNEVRQKANRLNLDNFDVKVKEPNDFSTVIHLKYTHDWSGDQHADVSYVKDVFSAVYRHSRDIYSLMLPLDFEPRVPTPETKLDFDITHTGSFTYDEFRGLARELEKGNVYDIPVDQWVGDWVKRCRLERISEVVPGMGPATTQDLYNEIGGIGDIQQANDDEILDVSMFLNPDSCDVLKGRV